MSKTYTLQATLNTGRLTNSNWQSDAWTNFFYNSDDPVGYSGYDSPRYYATNMLFDQATLAALRGKSNLVTGVTLTVNCTQAMTGETYIGYKYNSTASGTSTSLAWARSTNVDNPSGASDTSDTLAYIIPAQTLSTGTQTFTLKGTSDGIPFAGVPKYGLVAGPRRLVSGRWRFTSATLKVTTSETDYSYTLAYDLKGGSGTFSNQTGGNTGTSPSYTFTISSGSPTKTGYTFLGWSTSSSATTASYSPGGSITVTSSGTTTLYAVWKIITYTVSYDVNGGSGTFASQTKNYGASITIHATKPTKASASAGSYTVTYNANGGSAVTAASSARTTAYTFSAWNTAQNGSGTSYAAGATYSANASATLYAQYTSATTTAAVTLGSTSRTGYTFNGWYTAASGGTRVGGAGSSYTPTGNVTLYAQWTASSATLSSVSPTTIDCGGTLTGNWTSTGPYYYWLRVTCGNGVGRWSSSSASGTGSLSLTVQIPTEWYTMTDGPMRDSDRATATCTLYTYSDSAGTVLVGTPSSLTFTAKVPTSVVPSLSALTASSSSDNAVVSGWGSTVFVQGYSKVTLTQPVSSYNGSRFSSVRYSGLGLDSTKTGSLASSDPSSVINSAGTFTYTATVTDTRGRSASKTVTVTFQPYAQPSVSYITVARCDDTAPDYPVNNAAGLFFKAIPSYGFSSVSGNNHLQVQTIQYRIHPNGGWSAAETCASDVMSGPWSSALTNSYDVMVTLADDLQVAAGTSSYTHFTTTLPTVQGVWIGKGNDRLGLGGVPEGAGLYCDWNATFKGVVDVRKRHSYNTLPTANNGVGWYRVMIGTPIGYQSTGALIKFRIVQWGDAGGVSSNHEIMLSLTTSGAVFQNETSNGTQHVTKIRCNRNTDATEVYVDIYYDDTTARTVDVFFEPYLYAPYRGRFASVWFTKVVESPANETNLTVYNFSSDIRPTYLKQYVETSAANYTIGSGNYLEMNYPLGLDGTKVVSIGLATWSNNSGPFAIFPYGTTQQKWYITGSAGTTINGARFTYWYID